MDSSSSPSKHSPVTIFRPPLLANEVDLPNLMKVVNDFVVAASQITEIDQTNFYVHQSRILQKKAEKLNKKIHTWDTGFQMQTNKTSEQYVDEIKAEVVHLFEAVKGIHQILDYEEELVKGQRREWDSLEFASQEALYGSQSPPHVSGSSSSSGAPSPCGPLYYSASASSLGMSQSQSQ